MHDRGTDTPDGETLSPTATFATRVSMAVLALLFISLGTSTPGGGLGMGVVALLGVGCAYIALTGRGVAVIDSRADGSRYVSGLTAGGGVVLFVVVTAFMSVVSNPEFPNRSGKLPAFMPIVLLLLVLALGGAAYRHRGWRRVGKGFVAAYAILTLGQCTGRWTEAADALLPDLPERERPVAVAGSGHPQRRVASVPANVPGPTLHLTFATPEGYARLAGVALAARRCAFAWRDSHPALGFPATRDELLAGPGCAADLRRRASDLNVVFKPPYPGTPRPITALRMAVHPTAAYGGPLPRLQIDGDGRILKYIGGVEPPFIVASPVPAIRHLEFCIRIGLANAAASSAVPATGVLAVPLDACDHYVHPVAGPAERAIPGQALTFGIDAASAISRNGSAPADTYAATLAVVEGDTMPGFTLDIRPLRGGRSYFVDRAGNVHVTAEARAATADDPLATRCDMVPARRCTPADMQRTPTGPF